MDAERQWAFLEKLNDITKNHQIVERELVAVPTDLVDEYLVLHPECTPVMDNSYWMDIDLIEAIVEADPKSSWVNELDYDIEDDDDPTLTDEVDEGFGVRQRAFGEEIG